MGAPPVSPSAAVENAAEASGQPEQSRCTPCLPRAPASPLCMTTMRIDVAIPTLKLKTTEAVSEAL